MQGLTQADETYLGHLLQGKTEKINYKVKKSIQKPKEEWVRVENTHEPVISSNSFEIVQNLMRADGRISVSRNETGPFAELLFCGDCREQMIRRINRYKGSYKVYDICSTKNRGEGCSRHSIEEHTLKELIRIVLCRYVNSFMEQARLLEQIWISEQDTSQKDLEAKTGNMAAAHNREVERLRKEQDKYYDLCDGLHEDLEKGIVTKQEFQRLQKEFKGRAKAVSSAILKQDEFLKEILQEGAIAARKLRSLQENMELKEIDRYILASFVKRIYVFEDKRVEIELYFRDTMLSK